MKPSHATTSKSFVLRNGKAVSFRDYETRAEALEAAGRPGP